MCSTIAILCMSRTILHYSFPGSMSAMHTFAWQEQAGGTYRDTTIVVGDKTHRRNFLQGLPEAYPVHVLLPVLLVPYAVKAVLVDVPHTA